MSKGVRFHKRSEMVLNSQPASWVVRRIWHAWAQGLLPAMEKPEQSIPPAKTKGRKSTPKAGVACSPCLESLSSRKLPFLEYVT